ncbi:MAG: hypothetical protein ACR2O4_02135, partial [Hyphomicrobiaceae bacterium]
MIDIEPLRRSGRTGRIIALACLFCMASHVELARASDAATSAPKDKKAHVVPPEEVAEDEPWYSSFWPLGDRKEVETLEEDYVPFQTEKDQVNSVDEVLYGKPEKSGKEDDYQDEPENTVKLLPPRPSLLVELGDGFLDTGKLDSGFQVPVIGAVWQPRFWAYAINRTTYQSFKDGRSGNRRETEIANRLDLFANLQLTGTEKILLGLRPTDQNRPNRFTRYSFSGQDEGFNNELNIDVETFFFEGDFGSLFPVLDEAGILPIYFGFTVGRQPLVFQEGILINDTVDAVGIIRNNIPFPGTSNLRVSAMWGWNRLDRNDIGTPSDEDMYGVFVAADTHWSTYNLDMIYVDDDNNRDGFYVGASAIQRIPSWGGISTAFR